MPELPFSVSEVALGARFIQLYFVYSAVTALPGVLPFSILRLDLPSRKILPELLHTRTLRFSVQDPSQESETPCWKEAEKSRAAGDVLEAERG